MHRRGIATIALVLLVTLSGCSFFSGSGPGPAPAESPTPTATAGPTATPATDATPTSGADSTPTATPATGDTGTPANGFPAGYDESGVADAGAALRGHVDGLSARDSFVFRYNGTVVRGDRLAAISILQAVDTRDGEAYVLSNVSAQGTLAHYFEDGTRYERFDPPGANNTEFASESVTYEVADFTGGELVRPLLENVTYGSVEEIESEGETFYRLSGTEYENPSSLFGPVDPENVTAFRAAIVVDSEGVVRRVAYQAELARGNETVFLDVHADVVGLDSTGVDRPDWFERAA